MLSMMASMLEKFGQFTDTYKKDFEELKTSIDVDQIRKNCENIETNKAAIKSNKEDIRHSKRREKDPKWVKWAKTLHETSHQPIQPTSRTIHPPGISSTGRQYPL